MRCKRGLRADGFMFDGTPPERAEWAGHALWCGLMRKPPTLQWSADDRWAAGLP